MSLGSLSPDKKPPPGVVLEERPPFVPRMVMTGAISTVAREVTAQWRIRDKFQGLLQYGIRPLDRLLFFGPPGNGKTLTCYWLARELQIPLYRVLCQELRGMYLGQTAKAVADACGFLNSLTTPAICLWDEVESIFIDRSQSAQACDREVSAALTIFMQFLDRWKAPTLLVLATNLVQQLDAALLSRVEMRLEFLWPTAAQCAQLIEYWCELLCNYGADEWGPGLLARAQQSPPASFRELHQAIACCARDWVAR